ncbi:hypothetical protein ACH79_39080 [Bradyrhizobium sp. CCBAU 051011]|nr:hypothetical protein ACH79_39080 [Bradyrhizobium sp. CCBAU 051011]
MRVSAPVRMESPLCRCDQQAAAVHAALCPSPLRRSQRLPSTAAAHAARCAETHAANRRSIGARRRAGASGHPALPMRRAATACGDVRGVCPILALVKRLQKEHPT